MDSLPLSRKLRIRLLVGGELLLPLALEVLAAIDRLAGVLQHITGNGEALVGIETESLFDQLDLIAA